MGSSRCRARPADRVSSTSIRSTHTSRYGHLINIPLTTTDFLYRARTVHGDRLAGVDEPGVPGALGRPSYRELLARCDGMHVALTQMGIGAGERVAVISPNALKLLVAPYAVTASGRVLVPINSRLAPEEAQFIIDDSGAALLLVDPILDAQFAAVRAPRRIVMDGERDADLFAPAPLGDWPVLDESAPATSTTRQGPLHD